MPGDPASLLPPNAAALERDLEAAGAARIAAIPLPLAQLMDPAIIEPELLPWLAWGLSVDAWDPVWPIERKRAAVAESIAIHRRKGTPAAVDAVLAGYDELLELVEWHQMQPPGTPHTFEISAPIDGSGGELASAAFAEAVVRDVTRVKPLREHLRFVQSLVAEARLHLVAAVEIIHFVRFDAEMPEYA